MAVGKDFFKDFPPVSTQEWTDKINTDLRGADFDKKLVWRTLEGFNVRPFYRQEDLQGLKHLDAFPGEFPYVRGNEATQNEWYIRQNIRVKDTKEANQKALNVLNRGANSIGYVLDCKKTYTKEEIQELLSGIHLDVVEINFVRMDEATFSHFMEVVKASGFDQNKIFGSINFGPLNRLTKRGAFKQDKDAAFQKGKALIELSKELPNFKVINIDASVFNNAGSSIVEELAFALSQGVETVEGLLAQGLTIDEIAPKIRFNFAVGTSYFMEIAKFRAARMLWAKLIESYKPTRVEICKMSAHGETSNWNKTVYDPYVNMLRTQTEGMAAVLGGVDSFVLQPFDSCYTEGAEFSERIARNQQLLLKEEVNLDKVVDPAGGSYYIESLTDAISEQAWNIFLEVEEKGGYISAFEAGYVKSVIEKTAQKRDLNIATRRENLLGSNQFPNFDEILDKSKLQLDQSCGCDGTLSDTALRTYRGAAAFEELRLTTDMYTKQNKRPIVQMLTIGNLNMRKARAQFACNFFACAGFEVHDHNGFNSVDEGVKYCQEQGARIVVVCSSDDEYETIIPEVASKLDKNILLVVAGAPACMEELKAKGIHNFIHVKSNVLETLKYYQKELGIS